MMKSIFLKKNTIYSRLMIPLAAVLLSLIIGFSILLVSTYKKNLDRSSLNKMKQISRRFKESLEKQSRSLYAIGNVILRDTRIHHALELKSRSALMSLCKGNYLSLHKSLKVTHFYFHLPDRNNLVRIHKPHKIGGLISRYTLLEAVRTGKVSSGIELGSMGTFTLRIVIPIVWNKKNIGYLELGKEIEDILDVLYKNFRVDIGILIKKSFLKRKQWEIGMKMLKRNFDWNFYHRKVLIYSSLPIFPKQLTEYLDHPQENKYSLLIEIELNNRVWHVMTQDLQDVSGSSVGYMIVMNNVSKEKSSFYNYLKITLSAGLLTIFLLFVFFHYILRHNDTFIQTQQSALNNTLQQNKNLLRELQHRAKNNFFMVVSMIELVIDDDSTLDKPSALREIVTRVQAIAEMYDLLYVTDSVDRVNLDDYLIRVARSIPLLSKTVHLTCSCDSVSLSVKKAVPLGIIVSELITNASKHAFQNMQQGEIHLSIHTDQNEIAITIQDNGRGIPNDIDPSATKSLGLRLVNALVKQIHAIIRIVTDGGTRVVIQLPQEDNQVESSTPG